MEIKIDTDFIKSIINYGILPLLALIFLLLVYHWDKVDNFITFFKTLISGIIKSGNSEVLRLSIQSEMNSAITELDTEVPGLFDKAIKVEWLEQGKEHANLDKKGIYIRVQEDKDADKLLLKSIDCLFERILLGNSRPYIHGHIFESIKLILIERILSITRYRSAMVVFRSDRYNPTLLNNKSIAQATRQLEYLDNQGLFTRVFLRECNELASVVGIGHESSKPKWELSSFLEFTTNLFKTLDNKGVRADFEYSSSTINVAFAILADEYAWASRGLDFYKKRTRISIRRGAATIYIIALGPTNIKIANSLGIWLQHQEYIASKYVSNYKLSITGRNNIPAICVRCDVKAQAISRVIDDNKEKKDVLINDTSLHNTIMSVVRDPDIEIIKSAWIKGYQAQVVVHSKNPAKNVMQLCIGKGGSTGKEINRLAGEYVRFIEWSSDLVIAIENNLDTHDHSDVINITLDPANRLAYVSVKSTKTIRELLGKEGKTLMLAEALIEYSIDIGIDPKSELVGLLSKTIPEISRNEIKIENVVIMAKQEIRVLVSSNKFKNPDKICAGYLDQLRTLVMGNEKIYFCNKHSNKTDAIICSLYPLRKEDVLKVIEESPSKYIVVIKDRSIMASAIGTDGAHVRAASKLLDIWIELATPDEIKE
ncbi:MAG: hypothetical protein MUO30_06055 [Anaerolineales bacterium]|nr:hypothetical protein [Anaerolineales bacterium]